MKCSSCLVDVTGFCYEKELAGKPLHYGLFFRRINLLLCYKCSEECVYFAARRSNVFLLEESIMNSWLKQEIFFFSEASRQVPGATQSPV